MRQSLGFTISFVLHASFMAFALFWSGGQTVRVSMDRPVYSVDLVTLAPPPPGPAPVVEAVSATETAPSQVPVPVVEAASEPVAEIKPVPVVEAKPEPKDISPTKVDRQPVVKKEEKPKPEPKPEPKKPEPKKPEPKKPEPKPQKTAEQMLAEGLATAQAKAKTQEQQQSAAIARELAAIKKREGAQVYAHGGQQGGQEGGIAGGVVGGSGSGLSEVYALIVGSAIKKNWRYPSFAGETNMVVTVEISLDGEGRILSSRVIQSSNNPEFDSSALRAIRETESVERPRTDRDRVLRINFNSQELSE
ncbi:TonB family protein [Pseudodesulfovibrio sp. F-1]|uniref:TonB family protein n=1 Tax=Pseudodesulfovibrio alkaliphilus TaxID=2661613 RepID=A0A7K1KPW8_9BACT|nr:TonB family protein [Pseudodesulfovibrio alkaliphilus]MUM78138.1 TonB family protein [Pseudodesulfovibrio alkaliphilus]